MKGFTPFKAYIAAKRHNKTIKSLMRTIGPHMITIEGRCEGSKEWLPLLHHFPYLIKVTALVFLRDS